MKKNLIFIGLCASMCASISCANTAEIDLKKTSELAKKDGKPDGGSSVNVPGGGSMGKTSGTAIMSVITGGLMTGALKLVKDFDGMSGPFTYAVLAGALLLSLYDMINRAMGPEYGAAACWGALAFSITSGLAAQAVFD